MQLSFHRRIKAILEALVQRIMRRKGPASNRKEPEMPEDPYAYVTAPRNPRTPNRSAAAVAEWPEE
jgi:hypothetical protein